MKKTFILIIFTALTFSNAVAQEDTIQKVKIKDTPVWLPFESGYLIDNQTSVIPAVKTLEYVIQHKFGNTENGRSDLWGIYAPGANIRLGFNYVLARNFQVGVGFTKKNKYSDFSAKWTILEQTRKNKVPVAVTLYGNFAIDGRDISAFETGKVQRAFHVNEQYSYKFPDRLSYFSQLIIGRKFTDWLSLQTAVSFTHYNATRITSVQVADGRYIAEDHDKIGLHFSGRARISPQTSFIFNYDIPLKIKNISEEIEWLDYPRPNLAFGVEISTGTHVFQIYMGTADGIIPQDVILYNQNDWKNSGLAIGFTITRLWEF